MNQLEQKIDKALEELGVKAYVYHIRAYGFSPRRKQIWVFNAITIANTKYTPNKFIEIDVGGVMDDLVDEKMIHGDRINPATWAMKELHKIGYQGIAICDRRDNFSRKRGRIISKGRLLRYLQRKEVM